jgi:hypothetical protein
MIKTISSKNKYVRKIKTREIGNYVFSSILSLHILFLKRAPNLRLQVKRRTPRSCIHNAKTTKRIDIHKAMYREKGIELNLEIKL